MEKLKTAREFIRESLCDEIEDVGRQHPYLAFAMEAIAIEFLGKAINKELPWNTDPKESKRCFKNAIEKLGHKYQKHAEMIYKELRCGMLHFFGPKPNINLIRRSEAGKYGRHLSRDQKGRLILVYEDMHEDFKSAVNRLLGDKEIKKDGRNKLNRPFLEI